MKNFILSLLLVLVFGNIAAAVDINPRIERRARSREAGRIEAQVAVARALARERARQRAAFERAIARERALRSLPHSRGFGPRVPRGH